MNIKKTTVSFLIWMMGLPSFSLAQTNAKLPLKAMNFGAYLQRVGTYNLAYHAELLALDIALAQEESARIFEDPSFSLGATDNGQRRMKMGHEFESTLEWTLELGGKRKARINAARSQTDLTRILLSDYFHQLRANATTLFMKGIREKSILDIKVNSYKSMKKLAHADSIRFELGDIMEIDARQSKIEATLLFNELIQQRADWEDTVMEINQLMGHHPVDFVYQPEGEVNDFEKNYVIEHLLVQAQENRADLKAALQNKQLSKHLLLLVKAERSLDLGLLVGVGHNTVVSNTEAFTPAMTSITAGIAIPLKFSNQNKGTLKAAQYALTQSELHYQNATLGIRYEVHQAFSQFQASKKLIQQFDADLLKSAQRILDGQVYRYQRGESSLLEVLNAQRTYNELQESYHESLFAFHSSLVNLQRVAGIWDIAIH